MAPLTSLDSPPADVSEDPRSHEGLEMLIFWHVLKALAWWLLLKCLRQKYISCLEREKDKL